VAPVAEERSGGTIYTVKVDLGKEDTQVVSVDLDEGPLVLQLDGSSKFLKEVPTFTRVADGAPAFGPGKPNWSNMTSCDKTVMLDMAARLNKRARERIDGAVATGEKLECNMPDFIKHFEPRSKDQEAEFWKGFRFERSEEEVVA